MTEAIYLASGVLLGAGITYAVMHRRMGIQEHLKAIGEQIMESVKEKLGSEKEIIKTDLDGKKDAIKTLVDEIRLQRERLLETGQRLRPVAARGVHASQHILRRRIRRIKDEGSLAFALRVFDLV